MLFILSSHLCTKVMRVFLLRFSCFSKRLLSWHATSSLEQTSARKMSFSPICSAICGGCLALGLSAIDARAAEAETSGIREQLLQQERDRWLQQQQLESKPQQPPPSPSVPIPDYPEQETPCFTIHSIGYANPEAETLSAYNTQAIQVNGNTVISAGSPQHYFNATESQRADRYINTFLGQEPSDLLPGKLLREAEFLGYLSTRNGEAEADYTLEENLLGGLVGNKIFKTIAEIWRDAKVNLAGDVFTSLKGFINTQQVTKQSIEATLSKANKEILATINTEISTVEQGSLRETVMNNYFIENGFKPLNGKCGANCFDGVYVKGDKVYVVESKPLKANGAVQLNPAVEPDPASGYEGLPMQMTKEWVENRAINLKGSNDIGKSYTGKLILNTLKINPDNLVRVIVASDNNRMVLMKMSGR